MSTAIAVEFDPSLSYLYVVAQDARDAICPVCGAGETAPARDDVRDFEYFVRPTRPFGLRRCRRCDSEYLAPRPSGDELPPFYPPEYHAYNEDHGAVASLLVGVRARLRGRAYRQLLGGRPGRLFDVGAGDCRHFDELRRYCDLECAGVEIQPAIAARGRARGYAIEDGMLETMPLDGHESRYDIVSMNHVLEHVIHPGLVLERALRLLRPGGWLVGQLPARTSWEARLFGRYWGGYHFPRHLQAFSHAGLRTALAAAGFVDVKVTAAPHIQTAVSMQNMLIGSGWRPRMHFGKSPLYGVMLLGVLPFESVAWLCGRSGMMNFAARKPS